MFTDSEWIKSAVSGFGYSNGSERTEVWRSVWISLWWASSSSWEPPFQTWFLESESCRRRRRTPTHLRRDETSEIWSVSVAYEDLSLTHPLHRPPAASRRTAADPSLYPAPPPWANTITHLLHSSTSAVEIRRFILSWLWHFVIIFK